MAELMFAIILDRVTDDEREAVQYLIKSTADVWWHEFADLWIVEGGSAKEWRDKVGDLVDANPSAAALVLQLPNAGARNWAWYGNESRAKTRWLHVRYWGKPPPWD